MGTRGEHPPHPEHPPPPPRFVCKNNGVLFENQLLQIGVKSEFRQNLGVLWGCGLGSPGGLGLRDAQEEVVGTLTEPGPSPPHRPHVSLLWQQDLGAVPELLAVCGPPWRPPDSYPLAWPPGLSPAPPGLPALLATGKERDPGPDSRPAFLLENLNNTFSDSVICGTVVASFP